MSHELARVCAQRSQRVLGAHLHGLDRIVSILLVRDVVVDRALNHILKSQNSTDLRCIDLQWCAAPQRLQMRCQIGVESVAKASESSCSDPVFANYSHVALAFLKPVVYRLEAVILRHKKRHFKLEPTFVSKLANCHFTRIDCQNCLHKEHSYHNWLILAVGHWNSTETRFLDLPNSLSVESGFKINHKHIGRRSVDVSNRGVLDCHCVCQNTRNFIVKACDPSWDIRRAVLAECLRTVQFENLLQFFVVESAELVLSKHLVKAFSDGPRNRRRAVHEAKD